MKINVALRKTLNCLERDGLAKRSTITKERKQQQYGIIYSFSEESWLEDFKWP